MSTRVYRAFPRERVVITCRLNRADFNIFSDICPEDKLAWRLTKQSHNESATCILLVYIHNAL